jgi:flagellar hook-associated protein 3 FlgL
LEIFNLMRLATHTISENLVRQIQQLGVQQSKLQTAVGTGLRISQPEDDPAAVGRVLNLESSQRQVTQFKANATRALNLSQASYAGLQGLKKVSDRATEIGTLGGGTLSSSAAGAYAFEVNQLIEQAVQIGNSRLGADYLYAGTAVSAPAFAATRDSAGQVTAVAYQGDSERAALPLTENATLAPTTDGVTNVGMRDFMNQLVALREALRANQPAAVATAQGHLVGSEDALVSAIAEQGGVQARIEAAQAQLADRSLSLQSLVSSEIDTDLPTAIVKLSQTQTAYQAALQSAANIMKISLLDYIR